MSHSNLAVTRRPYASTPDFRRPDLWAGGGRAGRRPDDPVRRGPRARIKWENAILVFGDQSTGQFSLRLRDKDVTAPHHFHFKDLWVYDRETRKWKKTPAKAADSTVAPLEDKENDPSPDELLVDLPIDLDTVGLFYARWRIDDVNGATFFRLGPPVTRQATPKHEGKPGSMRASVPIDKTHAESDFIPDPRVVCEKDPETSTR